jgi:L-alanine-DL-glutamate epimerase-like enolase superfamily enzyme
VPNASLLEVHGFGLERYLAHPLAITDGLATAPDRPGHGVELDWAALEEHRQEG